MDGARVRALIGGLDAITASATPGPWERIMFGHGGSRIIDTREPRVLIADTYQAGDHDLFMAAPAAAKALAETLRAMEARYVEHVAGQAPAAMSGCICHFCEHRRAVLAAVEPLLLAALPPDEATTEGIRP